MSHQALAAPPTGRVDARGRIEPTLGRVQNSLVEGETFPSSDRVRMGELFGAYNTDSGAVVTDRSAMRVAAVYACVRLIAGVMAGLPKSFYERQDNAAGKKIKHDFWWLLNERPCPSFSAATFWEWMVASVLLRGDGIAWIKRSKGGRPLQLVPFHRDSVTITRKSSGDPRQPKRNTYSFHTEDGSFGAEEEDVLHFPGFGFDGCQSMSVIQWGARNGIGIAQRSDEFAGKYFRNGGQPNFVVKTDGKMQESQKNEFTEAWERKYGGYNTGPSNRPLILTEGLSVEQLSVTGRDAQLLESRQWQVIDIARAFGLPPHMIGEMGKATYNNTENLGVDVVKYTLGPHIVRFEQELNIKLFRMPKIYVRMQVDGLQRGDLVTRGNYYKVAVGGTQNPGWLTVNEIRALEDRPPIAGGDDRVVPSSNTPEPEADPEPNPPPNDGADEPQEDDAS